MCQLYHGGRITPGEQCASYISWRQLVTFSDDDKLTEKTIQLFFLFLREAHSALR
jgi:hypothetical protein